MQEIIIQIAILAVGFALLVKGADYFVDGAAGIARRFGISQLIIGLTIVAMGTSAPEAAVSITAAAKGNAAITIGNVVGSNIINLLIILGLSALVRPLVVGESTQKIEIPFVTFITLVLLFLGWDGQISRIDGGILWALFGVFFVYLFWSAKHPMGALPETVEELDERRASGELTEAEEEYGTGHGVRPLWINLLLTLVGLVMIIWGSDLAVDSASKLAEIVGLSQRFIGLTIVALGTSLPELVTSIMAAKKGNTDMAVGNIIGSNIFNILFVVGTSAVLIPVPFADNFRVDVAVAAGSTVLLSLICLPKKQLTRAGGILLLVVYAGYFVTLLF